MHLRQKSSRYSASVLFFAAFAGVMLITATVVSGFKTDFEIWLACALVVSLILHARAGFALSKAQQEIDILKKLVAKFQRSEKKTGAATVHALRNPSGVSVEDAESLDRVKDAIENDRIDLYLQPIVSLPDRKLQFFEAFSRLRNSDGTVLLPADYLEAAERANRVGLIDNMILLRAVQALRTFSKQNRDCRIFCNLSPATIFDSEFFDQFTDYLDLNRDLAEQLVFEFTYPATEMMNKTVVRNLASVARRGYAFSVDHIGRFDFNLAALREKNFRYVKASSALLLREGDPERILAFRERLRAHDLELIVEKVEREAHLREILSLGVRYAQGELFGAPRPAEDYVSQTPESVLQLAKAS